MICEKNYSFMSPMCDKLRLQQDRNLLTGAYASNLSSLIKSLKISNGWENIKRL